MSLPYRLFNATSRSEKVAFHLLQKDTHNRIQMKPHRCGLGPVERADLVKGYEYEKDRVRRLLRRRLREDARGLNFEQGDRDREVRRRAGGRSDLLDTPYYRPPTERSPRRPTGSSSTRCAIRRRWRCTRIVLANRERLIALTCRDQGFLMMTLRTADEVRKSKDYFTDIKPAAGSRDARSGREADRAEVRQVRPERVQGPLSRRGGRMVKAKIKGQEPVLAKAPERGEVINLMDALRRSLEDAKPPAESKPRRAATRRPRLARAATRSRRPATRNRRPTRAGSGVRQVRAGAKAR